MAFYDITCSRDLWLLWWCNRWHKTAELWWILSLWRSMAAFDWFFWWCWRFFLDWEKENVRIIMKNRHKNRKLCMKIKFKRSCFKLQLNLLNSPRTFVWQKYLLRMLIRGDRSVCGVHLCTISLTSTSIISGVVEKRSSCKKTLNFPWKLL